MKLLNEAFSSLTEKQYKYVIAHYVSNKKAREIAKEEGVDHQVIDRHLNATVNKIRKVFS